MRFFSLTSLTLFCFFFSFLTVSHAQESRLPQKPFNSSVLSFDSQIHVHQISNDVSLELLDGFIVGVRLKSTVGNKKEWHSLLGSRYLIGDVDKTDITPLLWRELILEVPKADGSLTQVTLLRPLWWLQENQVEEQSKVHLLLPEIGIDAFATVLEVSLTTADSRNLKPGQRLVTGTFTHQNAIVLDLTFQSGTEETVLSSTPNHPLFSFDRQTWIEAGELGLGEQVQTLSGSATLMKREQREGTYSVFNLEVHQDHNYYVSCFSLLAHNSYPDKVFHGTDSKSAKSIVTEGLNKKKWREAGEGSGVDQKGFSVTTDKQAAKDWAKYRSIERGGDPVVLEANSADLPLKQGSLKNLTDPNELFVGIADFSKVGPGIFKVSK